MKELDGGKAFRELLGNLAKVPRKEADQRAKLERKRKLKKRKPKR